ncbi:MAG TPA: zinc ABC transporter substrate-binding protein [Acidimicrobiales bacterium]|nr:zinc ABC transporter substrate-binding protein [Acidimicrobiales bacterium]
MTTTSNDSEDAAVGTTTFLTHQAYAPAGRTSLIGPGGWPLGGVGAMLGRMRRPCKRPSPWHAPVIVVSVISVLAAGAGLAGCGGAPARSARTGPARSAPSRTAQPRPAPIEVVVSVFPLAQLTSYVGGTAVHVVDLAPPDTQPQDISLSAAGREEIEHAAVVIDVGDGYQPEVESAAGSARRHLSVLPAVSKQGGPYEFWLDPYLMADAAAVIAEALTGAEPAERSVFEDGSRNFAAVANSIESDFESTFTDCTINQFITSDNAFERLASSFDLTDVAVDALGVKKTAALVRASSLHAVFSEVGVPSGQVQEVATSAGVPVKSLNPMELAPSPAGPAPPTYFAIMEDDLTALEGPLGCDTTGGI